MENLVVKKRQQRSVSEIKSLLDLQRQSGLSVKSFCVQHGIAHASFHNWKKRFLHDAVLMPEAGFTKLEVRDAIQPPLFAEVKGIRLYQAVSADFLKALLS